MSLLLRRSADEAERWRLALEASGAGVWDWHLASGHEYRSPLWGAMLGYTPDETAGLEWRNLLHLEDRDEALRRLEACLHGATAAYEAETPARQGRQISLDPGPGPGL